MRSTFNDRIVVRSNMSTDLWRLARTDIDINRSHSHFYYSVRDENFDSELLSNRNRQWNFRSTNLSDRKRKQQHSHSEKRSNSLSRVKKRTQIGGWHFSAVQWTKFCPRSVRKMARCLCEYWWRQVHLICPHWLLFEFVEQLWTI